ncbi:GMC family oxidoreductase N-terminal domain-containing protein [Sinorhizobium medicae]|uniref:GMC family oxidoreductase N-terminal domain-containing protein n=1 Tax=Sinorhizobium medicae TaxID=110321 RepID=UPI0027DE0597|nr:GMC family oxidoreductase N-terminal domain-containing protein [Sinorhizobium medicae]
MAYVLNKTERVTPQMRADVVVVGSGPGGAVTAALCAEAGRSVLLVEEGPNLPVEWPAHFSRDEILHKYRNAGVSIALGSTQIAYVEGRCVGGGSEINRGLYHRSPAYVLDGWSADFEVHQLSLDELMPHFTACEEIARVEYLPGEASGMSTRLYEGAMTLGWHVIEAPRLYRYTGRASSKQSMSETFVPRFLEAGGWLIADTVVRHLSRSGGKWRLDATHAPAGGDPQPVEISADKVFVACGAVQTPALLRRSGLRKNIGNSLRFHPMLKVVAEFEDEVNVSGDFDPVHQIKEFEPHFGMGCSISSRPMLALAMASRPDCLAQLEHHWRRMGIYYVQTTGGCAMVRNLPLFRDPLIRVRHSEWDLHQYAEGLRRLAEALLAAGAIAIYPAAPGYPVLRSMADLRRLPESLPIRSGNLTSVHLFSSCPMGENDALCATDSFGRVRETDGLYIADASLLCGPTVVNPQGTVMAIAHRNAAHAIENRFI